MQDFKYYILITPNDLFMILTIVYCGGTTDADSWIFLLFYFLNKGMVIIELDPLKKKINQNGFGKRV
jgi:uncharacterized protein YgfB (UPF0149 family)